MEKQTVIDMLSYLMWKRNQIQDSEERSRIDNIIADLMKEVENCK